MQAILESLKRQRDQILEQTGEEMLSRHTSLLEIAIISLYNRLANRLDLDKESFQLRSGGAIVALGALGRGLVGPYEQVRILFLTTESLPWEANYLDEIRAPLVEAGWLLDARHATPPKLMEEAGKDFASLLDLLETRYISGNRDLAEELDGALQKLIEGRRDEYLRWLHEKVTERGGLVESPERWLEPDLMENPGGLGDIVAIRQACRMASDIRNFEDAIFYGYLARSEVDALRHAEKCCVLWLNLLKHFSRNGGSIIRFEDQELLAEKLGYPSRSGFLPVEVFMQHLHQLLHSVGSISVEFWERLEETRWEPDNRQREVETELEAGATLQSGKICVQPSQYPASAENLIHLFVLAAENGASFDNNTRRWIQHHRNLLDVAADNPALKDQILALIRSDPPELPVFRRFYGQTILTSLIPELSAVHGLVQYDSFHVYPVHENHLRTLSEVKKLLRGDYSKEEPELTRIAQMVEDPSPLYWAALFHNIGKAAGHDHALKGGEMIPSIARRLGLTPEESDMVQFLVAHHPLLRDSASMRHLGDEEMLSRCSLVVNTPERLDLLLLLSFADMRATGPQAREQWRQTLVLPLYERVRELLEKGEPSPQAIAERMGPLMEHVWQELADFMDKGELETHFSQLPPRYLLSMSPGQVARHLRLEASFNRSQDAFAWELDTTGPFVTLTFLCREAPAMLAQVAGVLALHDLNIVEAQVFTKTNGILLLIFQCSSTEEPGGEGEWNVLMEDVKRVLNGKLALEYRIATHAVRRISSPGPARSFPVEIRIDNDSSEIYTILETFSMDRVGLLYTITRALEDLHLRIQVAKISTKGDRAINVFYVKTREGNKVMDPEQVREIENALRFWLDRPFAPPQLDTVEGAVR